VLNPWIYTDKTEKKRNFNPPLTNLLKAVVVEYSIHFYKEKSKHYLGKN